MKDIKGLVYLVLTGWKLSNFITQDKAGDIQYFQILNKFDIKTKPKNEHIPSSDIARAAKA